jgi:hypothetical protein
LESDAEGIKQHGFVTFQRDRDRIVDVGCVHKKYRKSRLTYKTAETYSYKLGEEILAYGEEIWNGMKNEPVKWQAIETLGKILKLGRDTQYYNQC